MENLAHGGWLRLVPLGDDIWRLDETYVRPGPRCLIWYVRGRRRSVLIDAGYGLLPLAPFCHWLQDPDLSVIATHSHFDHIGGLHQFSQRWGHSAEAEVYANPDPVNTQSQPYLSDTDALQRIPPCGYLASAYRVQAAPLSDYLHDGTIIDLGNRRLEVLHTPGHSPGSICLWDAASGVLFSGDTLYDGPLYDQIPGASRAELLAAHARLAQLPVRVVHPGHYGSFDGRRLRELITAYAHSTDRDSTCRN